MSVLTGQRDRGELGDHPVLRDVSALGLLPLRRRDRLRDVRF
jgi:hypothetical protein